MERAKPSRLINGTNQRRIVMVRSRQYFNFWNELFHLLCADFNLDQALVFCHSQYDKDDRFYQGIEKIAQAVEKKTKFSTALAKSKLFSPMEIDWIKRTESGKEGEPTLTQAIVMILDNQRWRNNQCRRLDQYIAFYSNVYEKLYCNQGIIANMEKMANDPKNHFPLRANCSAHNRDFIAKVLLKCAKVFDAPLRLAVEEAVKSFRAGDTLAASLGGDFFSIVELSLIDMVETQKEDPKKDNFCKWNNLFFRLYELSLIPN